MMLRLEIRDDHARRIRRIVHPILASMLAAATTSDTMAASSPAIPNRYAASRYGISADATATANTRGLMAAFAATTSPTIVFGPGVHHLTCATFNAASAVSLIGAGRDRTILKLSPACTFSAPFMAWESMSGVRVSGLTIDLGNATYATLQPVLRF